MKSNKSNEGIQLTNRTFVVPEKLFRAQSVADTIHRQIGSAKKKQQPKSTSSKHLGQPLPFTPPSATCCNGWRICEAFQVVRAGCRLYHVTEAAIMGPFGLTTIGNIQALSPRILTVICPSGAPIDGSRCFMAQCDACVRLQGQIPPPPRAIYHHGIFYRCGGDLQDGSWIVIKIYGLLGERSATHPPSGRADEMMRFVFCLLESMKLLLRLYLGEL